MTEELNTSSLPGEVDLPVDLDDLILPDLYIDLRVDLLAPGDGVLTDRHHASAERYEPDDPQNQIGGQISPFPLSGHLRHGCEKILHTAGTTACHPGESSADFQLADVYHRDLDAGYHEKGSCVSADDAPDAGCVVYDLFGGFGDRSGRVIRRPVGFSPIRREVDVAKGEAEAHYRQLNTQVRSRNSEDEGRPLRQATRNVVANVEGTWRLTLRELKPEYVGLIVEAVSFLDQHSDEYEFQLGGARNFGCGIVDCEVLNPLYTKDEIRRVYNRVKTPSAEMQSKDEIWQGSLRDAFVSALQSRVAQRGDSTLPPVDGGDADA